jgi:hypothetical protein
MQQLVRSGKSNYLVTSLQFIENKVVDIIRQPYFFSLEIIVSSFL